ncbi:hypothetical protein [Morganella phage Mecenats66]|nr:hypothetical protein [Morganella phage Mecenats66]
MKIVSISDLQPGNFMTEEQAQADKTIVKKTANLSGLIYHTDTDGRTYSEYQNEPNLDRDSVILAAAEQKELIEAVSKVPDDMSGYPKKTDAPVVIGPLMANPSWVGTFWIMSSDHLAEGGLIYIKCGSNPPFILMNFNGGQIRMKLPPNQTTPILVPLGCRIELRNFYKAETVVTVVQGQFYADQKDKPYA